MDGARRHACGRGCDADERGRADGVGACCDYPTGRACARFNRWVERTTRAAVADGVACCGSACWTEGGEHAGCAAPRAGRRATA